jgi:hypothetical protein
MTSTLADSCHEPHHAIGSKAPIKAANWVPPVVSWLKT